MFCQVLSKENLGVAEMQQNMQCPTFFQQLLEKKPRNFDTRILPIQCSLQFLRSDATLHNAQDYTQCQHKLEPQHISPDTLAKFAR